MVGTAQERLCPPYACTDGQISRRDKILSIPPQKIFRFRRRANQFYQLAPSFPGKRGASRVVTNAGWDAVDAAASARKVIAGRS